MKAIVVEPGTPTSLDLVERKEPDAGGSLLVETIAIGVCGTDHEIIERGHGAPPPHATHLVLGHESLGRVLEAPVDSGFARGDLVAGIVRRPDPLPCACCATGRWDMCLNGDYVERGIKQADGYAAERFVLEPDFAVRVDESLGLRGVLVEPTSIVTKAWNKLVAFADLNCRAIDTVLVTGAGPIGLLAGLLGRARGFEVHVVDRAPEGVKSDLVEGLGATYHSSFDDCPPTDAVLECTGAAALIPEAITRANPNAIVCLAGVSEHATETVDVGALNRDIVLENELVFGSVNASRAHYEEAVEHLSSADEQWLDGLITRRVPLGDWRDAYDRRDGDVKTVIVFSG